MLSNKLKRSYESAEEKDTEVQSSSKRIHVTHLPGQIKSPPAFDRPTPVKRKHKMKEGSGEKNEVEKPLTSDTISFKPGQQTALLGIIRNRIRELESRTVYIRHLPRFTNEAQLKKFCPTSVAIKLSAKRRGGFRRGHAFVEFKSEEAARSAVQAASGKLIANRPMDLQLCSDRLGRSALSGGQTGNWLGPDRRQLAHFSMTTLAVSCVPRAASLGELHALFPRAEAIEIVMTTKKIPTGLCTVRFSNAADALDAFNTQHGALLHASPLVVNFAYRQGCSRKSEESQSLTDSAKASVEPMPLTMKSSVVTSSVPHLEKKNKKKPKNKSEQMGKRNTSNVPPKELKHPHGKAKSLKKSDL